MPTGHFQIGDLTFSYEGDLKELAHCQEIIREIKEAEYRLRRASGSEQVYVVYDRDLEGEQGTFDKLRLRAYDGSVNYTLDIGATDNNPLGIYVGYDANIEVYDKESKEDWEIDPDGNVIGKSKDGRAKGASPSTDTARKRPETNSGRPKGQSESYGPDRSRGQGTSTAGDEAARMKSISEMPVDRAMKEILKRAHVEPEKSTLVGDIEVGGKPLKTRIRRFAEKCGRGGQYMRRVATIFDIEDSADLRLSEVEEALRMFKDEGYLQQKEAQTFEADEGMPV